MEIVEWWNVIKFESSKLQLKNNDKKTMLIM